jgi:hypothetical protein
VEKNKTEKWNMERFKKKVERFALAKRLDAGSKRLGRVDFKVCCSEETTSTARYQEIPCMKENVTLR